LNRRPGNGEPAICDGIGYMLHGSDKGAANLDNVSAPSSRCGALSSCNPSAAAALPENYPAQDFGRLFDHTMAAGVGVVGIRVLAGGALSGSAERHPIASPPPEPIGSAMSYAGDVMRARRLMPLVKEGFAASLTEAATRFALSHPAMGAILVGMATPQQFEDALAAVQKGPLPPAVLDRLSALQHAFAAEPR
jgi:aryl-alcohol dehydrogenase-like predicted oxidoreductase